jgi:hypothetical protein
MLSFPFGHPPTYSFFPVLRGCSIQKTSGKVYTGLVKDPRRMTVYLTYRSVKPMTNEQEIRTKSLEIIIQMFSMLPPDMRMQFLSGDNRTAQQNIINTSDAFEKHLKEAKP